MMETQATCERAFQDDQAVRYLQGGLPEEEAEAFEVHLLECEACSDVVEAARLAREVLREDAPGMPAETSAERPGRRASFVTMGSLAAGLAAAAAAAIFVLRPAVVLSPTPSPGATPTAPSTVTPPGATPPSLETLTRVDPPTYVPLTFRGTGGSSAGFERAMAYYARRDYPAAAERLRGVVRERPAFGEAWFFLGVSELMAGRTSEARDTLTQTVELGQPPYAGAAAFFGAIADLRLDRQDAARAGLREVAAAAGNPYAAKARELLERLEAPTR